MSRRTIGAILEFPFVILDRFVQGVLDAISSKGKDRPRPRTRSEWAYVDEIVYLEYKMNEQERRHKIEMWELQRRHEQEIERLKQRYLKP